MGRVVIVVALLIAILANWNDPRNWRCRRIYLYSEICWLCISCHFLGFSSLFFGRVLLAAIAGVIVGGIDLI